MVDNTNDNTGQTDDGRSSRVTDRTFDDPKCTSDCVDYPLFQLFGSNHRISVLTGLPFDALTFDELPAGIRFLARLLGYPDEVPSRVLFVIE